jgi:simple sugar transport system permease protein
MDETSGLLGVLLALFGGALRVSTPFLFVSLGECLTEKSGRINLGQEGILVLGAMTAYAVSYLSGSPWVGVLAAGFAGMLLAAVHAGLCSLPRVNDIAVGIAVMLFGKGIAFYLGTPFIQPVAPQLPGISLGWWSTNPQLSDLKIDALFVIGCLLAPAMAYFFKNTSPGLIVRTVGDSADAARAMGYSVLKTRLGATLGGGFLAGVGGADLSLFYPGSWTQGLSSGQGLMAVALVIFARWDPVRCLWAALIFGGAGALGPALQSVGITQGYYLFYAAPYVVTLGILIAASSANRALVGAPSELSITK